MCEVTTLKESTKGNSLTFCHFFLLFFSVVLKLNNRINLQSWESDTKVVIVLCKYVNVLCNVIHLYCWFVGTTVIVQNGSPVYGICYICCVFDMNKRF